MRKLNIGNSDFKKLRLNDEYYVDKSLLIKNVLDGSDVTLLPRPRRFGKTLNMTTLRYFFEKTEEDNSSLFEGLKIAEDHEAMCHQGQYPVIYLSLKDVKGKTWDQAYHHLENLIAGIYLQFESIHPKLAPLHQKVFASITRGEALEPDLVASLSKLISHIFEVSGKPVVILIDEYDSPVIDAYQNGYYDEMISFMRSWLGGGLKHVDGMSTFRAVITGILRVTRESIFSDLNNLKVCGILAPGVFADKFGFTEEETRKILGDFQLSTRLPEVQEWYNGYKFGENTIIYNPWSLVNFIDNNTAPIGPQWLNTSSNSLVHQELAAGGLELKRDLEKLLAGEELRYPITEHTIFSDIGKNPQNIWSFLYFSGYLNAENPQRDILDQLTYSLSIPNREVGIVYQDFVERWQNDMKFTAGNDLLMALLKENYHEFQELLSELIGALISHHDVSRFPEAAYHCFALGLLANLRNVYDISSNPESGYGRADIIMRSKSPNCPLSFIIEFKVAKTDANAEKLAKQALKQINEKNYVNRLLEAGVNSENIRKLAVVIQGKQAILKSEL